jgi:adenylate kinase family enzyme
MNVEQQPVRMGRRIAVWGVTGSGKTTLAKRLGQLLRLTVVELDAIRHARGWNSADDRELREVLTRRLESNPDGWVIDGSYSAIMDVYLSGIDTLVWIHLPFGTSFWRLLKRTVSGGIRRTQHYPPDGPRESLTLSFFSKRSILWWSISMHRPWTQATGERIADLRPEVRAYELRSPREVEAFVRAVEAQARTAASP